MTDEPTQTTPTGAGRDCLGLPGEGGTEIPVPDKGDVMAALRTAAKVGVVPPEGDTTPTD